MNWTGWIPAISSSTIVGTLGYIFGVYFKAKTERNIQHKLDKEMEEVRARFRREEESLKADLRVRDEQIATLRSGALAGLAARQTAIAKRRLDAVDRLWAAAVDLGKFKLIATMAGSVKLKEAMDAAVGNTPQAQSVRKFAETILSNIRLEAPENAVSPDRERPFLHPLAWALFSAYRKAVTFPTIALQIIQSGVGSKFLADPTPLLDAIKAALPHHSSFVDESGIDGISFLCQALEDKLLSFLTENHEDDAINDGGALLQAASILKAVDEMTKQLNSTVSPTTTNPIME